ncbi:annexin A3b [Hemibagrus wyckioides]|uniref:annexin A3b n=1 Tax=Hemibagrus wyckioides TaxID=337641 RepID=UPI00266C941F|nr:annexin A3b [Hemibagrus wyckioides]
MACQWDDLSQIMNSPDSLSNPSRGTIKDKAGFNPAEDAAALKKAMKGFGTDEKVLINILTQRSSAQRQQICKAYKDATGKALVDAIKGDTKGNFEDILVALVTPPGHFDMQEVKKAIKGAGTTESTLIEILASRSNQQIKALSDAYVQATGKALTYDLKSEVGGDFGKALITLAEGKRDESKNVDAAKASADAKALYSAGEKRLGTDEGKFIEILCQRSVPQLRQTLVEYKNLSGKTLQQSIEREMNGDLEKLLVAVVKCVKSVPAYMAEHLHKSMKGAGTNEAMLTRIMVSRSEIDLMDIKAEYKKMYSRSLYSDIKSDTTGDYEKTLLGICGSQDACLMVDSDQLPPWSSIQFGLQPTRTSEMSSQWDDLSLLLDSPDSLSHPTRGTIKDKVGFNPNEDAAALRKAIEGIGTTEKTLIDILTQRSSAQRQQICKAYKDATGKSLVDDLEGDTHGHFEDILVALVTPPAQFDMQEIKKAMKGAGTTESTLIEILASRSNQQIKALSDAYIQETGKALTYDLKSEVGGDFGKALITLAEGKRDESRNVDAAKAKADAKALYEAGEKKWGTDEDKFIEILCHRSVPQLRQTLVEYKNLSGKTLQQSIESEMSGDLENVLVAVVKCVKSVPAYMAELLHKSMKGAGTNEAMLTRIMVSRSEMDMMDIKAEYNKMYGRFLYSDIESETSGDYEKTLLGICGSQGA